MTILAIESSCDETACALVKDGVTVLSSVVATSKELHEKTGGVVPEIAARKQVEFIVPVIAEVLQGLTLQRGIPDAIAVTVGPGLIGSLVVGVEAGKTLALVLNKPLIPVNHLVGHIYANFIGGAQIAFPAVALLVSGGHTDLILMRGHGDFEFLGGTVDDAAGEAFDKTARILGLAKYLGGALVSQKATECVVNTLKGQLPRPMINQANFDFSFSGLKASVKRLVDAEHPPVEVVAREFQEAVVEVLVAKTMRAVKTYHVRSLLVGGGVAANTLLRAQLAVECKKVAVALHIPPVTLCTDNAVYIASAAYFNQHFVELKNVVANPSLGIMDKV